jgi:assimilatory nitrate reductase catalytic subunit
VIAERAGLKAVDMFDAVGDGRIKALWIMATNPVVSMPNADAVRAAIEACPFVVVSDIESQTDTTRVAHVLLPSLGWGEKDGTVTNSERRISRQNTFLAGPGEAKPDWWQLAEVARRMGFEDGFGYETSAEIFAEHAGLSAYENNGSRDFDIGAHADIDADTYRSLEPFQWPQPRGATARTTRYFANGGYFHPDGKARFVAVDIPSLPVPDPEFPFAMNTGRIRDQWHTMTRTGRSARLSSHISEPFAEISPQDAEKIGVTGAELVQIRSRHGRAVVRVLVTDRQLPGGLFVPMHWNEQFASMGRIDAVVAPVVDQISGQPASKNVAVALGRFDVGAYGFAVSACRPSRLDASYWAVAKADGGWRTELGFVESEMDWRAWCRLAFEIPLHIEPVGYADRHGGQFRLAYFDGDRLIVALFVAEQPVSVSRNWAIAQLGSAHTDARGRLAVVAGRPGIGTADPGATVCSCFSVGINQIQEAVRDGCDSVALVGTRLNAGTNCGSCRPEIRRIIDGCHVAAAE